eukprot:9501963-Alexandrium_andersonii.AAC.1
MAGWRSGAKARRARSGALAPVALALASPAPGAASAAPAPSASWSGGSLGRGSPRGALLGGVARLNAGHG